MLGFSSKEVCSGAEGFAEIPVDFPLEALEADFLPELSTPTVVDSCRGISVTEDFLAISTDFSIGH